MAFKLSCFAQDFCSVDDVFLTTSYAAPVLDPDTVPENLRGCVGTERKVRNEVCEKCFDVLYPICNCPQGYYCNRRTYPSCTHCEAGFYCPNLGDSRRKTCPQGYYCPMGTWDPLPCDSLGICSKGSKRPIYVYGWALMGGAWFCIVLFSYLYSTLTTTYVSRTLKALRSTQHCATSATDKIYDANKSNPLKHNNGYNDTNYPKCTLIPPHTHALSLKGLTVKTSNKILLRNLCMDIRKSSVVAVMGPSGAGKSTLLQTLFGRFKISEGKILFRGDTVWSKCAIRQYAAMVPQDDILYTNLTVLESLLHAVRTKCPIHYSMRQVLSVVISIIQDLNIVHIEDSLISDRSDGISGGQKKKLSLGMELAGNPRILLLDEVTTGLDSIQAYEMVCLLKERAIKHATTMLCVVHSPSTKTFHLFDDVLLLGQSGFNAYFGNTKQAKEYVRNAYATKEGQPKEILDENSQLFSDIRNDIDFKLGNSSHLSDMLNEPDYIVDAIQDLGHELAVKQKSRIHNSIHIGASNQTSMNLNHQGTDKYSTCGESVSGNVAAQAQEEMSAAVNVNGEVVETGIEVLVVDTDGRVPKAVLADEDAIALVDFHLARQQPNTDIHTLKSGYSYSSSSCSRKSNGNNPMYNSNFSNPNTKSGLGVDMGTVSQMNDDDDDDDGNKTPTLWYVFWQYWFQMNKNFLVFGHCKYEFTFHCAMYTITGLFMGICFSQETYILPMPPIIREKCPQGLITMVDLLLQDNDFDINIKNWCSLCTPMLDNLAQVGMYTGMAVGIISVALSINTFGSNQLDILYRELDGSKYGIVPSFTGIFLSRMSFDILKYSCYTLCYIQTFLLFFNTTASFTDMYVIHLLLVWCMYGIGYLCSATVELSSASVMAIVMALVSMTSTGFVFNLKQFGMLRYFIFATYYGEVFYTKQTEALLDKVFKTLVNVGDDGGSSGGDSPPMYEVKSDSYRDSVLVYAKERYGYGLTRTTLNLSMMALAGFLFHTMAFSVIVYFYYKRSKL